MAYYLCSRISWEKNKIKKQAFMEIVMKQFRSAIQITTSSVLSIIFN